MGLINQRIRCGTLEANIKSPVNAMLSLPKGKSKKIICFM